MNTKKHHWILYIIATTIVVTIAIQAYWNFKSYHTNKQRVSNEIQLSLDNAIEEYYADLAKTDYITVINTDERIESKDFFNHVPFDTIFKSFPFKNSKYKRIHDSLELKKKSKIKSTFQITNIEIQSENEKPFNQTKFDSLFVDLHESFEIKNKSHLKLDSIRAFTQFKDSGKVFSINKSEIITDVKVLKGRKASDSIKLLNNLKSIYISFNRDTIEYHKLDSLLKNQLQQKDIDLSYVLNHVKNDTLFYSSNSSTHTENFLFANSKSTYIKPQENLKLLYENPFTIALKRSSTGLLLSLLLSLAIISSLFYLLHIINKQKELAEIKNDLISNITHEFKTPITTVSTALEAINNFNAIKDKEKTKKYLSISTDQLTKLHQMVEKLLETATLDSEKLLLQKEPTNIVGLVERLTQKQEIINSQKDISFSSNVDELLIDIDPFHFENAITNLVDNAIKYGGNQIEIVLNTILNTFEINIVDNGAPIDKQQREKIFDKFYRIPKGNTHDVKGFGIGLYYTRKIIEKHGGNIVLVPNTGNTQFKISIPI